MYELAKSTLADWKKSARLGDLDAVILLFREALLQRQDPHPGRVYALHNLAMGLVTRFDHLSRVGDLDEAISLIRDSGAVPRPDDLGHASGNARRNVRMCLLHLDVEKR